MVTYRVQDKSPRQLVCGAHCMKGQTLEQRCSSAEASLLCQAVPANKLQQAQPRLQRLPIASVGPLRFQKKGRTWELSRPGFLERLAGTR